MDIFSNYQKLVSSVDTLCARIAAEHGKRLACSRGCDSCCRHLSLFPVEAYALAAALAAAPEPLRTEISSRAAETPADAPCPLLRDGICLLYTARPLICRTHGFPLLLATDRGTQVDYCPLNFVGVDTLPGSAVIQLDRLNETLAAVNSLFLRTIGKPHPDGNGRLTVAAALLLEPLRTD